MADYLFDEGKNKIEGLNKTEINEALNSKANAQAVASAFESVNTLINGKVSKIDAPSYNLFNGEFMPDDGFYNGSTITNMSSYKVTKPIYLNAGNYYYNLIVVSYGSVAPFFARTNQLGDTFTKMTATDTGKTITINNRVYEIYAFTITEPDYYLFNANTGSTETASSAYFMITNQNDGIPTQYVPYKEVKKFENGILLSDDMIEEIRKLNDVNPLFKKKISADGDSICYGNGYRGGYAKLISENNQMSYENIAVGGGTITAETYSSSGARHWICRTMQNLSEDSDYILIEGGVNDASLNVTLGEISSGYNATLDDSTFYGAIETIFKTLTTKFVGKKYCFIIPHRMAAGMYPNGDYNNAIVECGKKWGVPIIDLSKSVPPFNSFRNNEQYNVIREEYTTDGDGWHPTEECYIKYYVPQIEAFIKAL